MQLPFDGAISAYFENQAPNAIRNAIRRAEEIRHTRCRLSPFRADAAQGL